MLDMAVRACFDTTGTIKTEMTMRVIMWHMAKESKKAKLHKVAAPTVQQLKTVSFQLAECYDWNTRKMRLRKGDDPESNDWSSWIEGISRNGQAVLVGVNEMNLTSEGHLPRVDVHPANNELHPFQIPPNAIKISLGVTEDYWRKAQLDRFLTLSIGTPITSELAFMTMFNEAGRIDGGTYAKTDEFGSERLYGPKRYPASLRMLSKEVDDVLVQRLKRQWSPWMCSLLPRGSADACRNCVCVQPGSGHGICDGVTGCQTGNGTHGLLHWTRSQDLRPLVARKGHAGKHPGDTGLRWRGLVSDTHQEWKDVLHVDNWCDAQHVQRQGTSAENELLVLSRRDRGRRIWPVAVSATRQHSVGSSNAVKSANSRFPWAGSGFDLTLGMTAAYKGPGGVRTSLLATAQSLGSLDPGRGTSSTATSSTAKDAGTSSMPPPSVPSSALTKAVRPERQQTVRRVPPIRRRLRKAHRFQKWVVWPQCRDLPQSQPATVPWWQSPAPRSRSLHRPFKVISLPWQNRWGRQSQWRNRLQLVSRRLDRAQWAWRLPMHQSPVQLRLVRETTNRQHQSPVQPLLERETTSRQHQSPVQPHPEGEKASSQCHPRGAQQQQPQGQARLPRFLLRRVHQRLLKRKERRWWQRSRRRRTRACLTPLWSSRRFATKAVHQQARKRSTGRSERRSSRRRTSTKSQMLSARPPWASHRCLDCWWESCSMLNHMSLQSKDGWKACIIRSGTREGWLCCPSRKRPGSSNGHS